MPKLYIAESGDETVYEIFDDEVSLGRGAANAVQIHGTGASKMHAVIRRLQGHWKVIDLESRNGTRVNGRFRNQHWLSDGDALVIGTASVRYAADGAAQGSPAAAAGVAAKPQPVKAVAAKPVVAARPAAPVAPAAVTPPPVMPPPVGSPPPPPPAAAPSVVAQAAAPAPSAVPVVSRSRRSAAPRRGREPRDDYDDEYDDDDRPPPRRKSNSSTIVILGIVGAIGFVVLLFAVLGGGSNVNQEVYVKAERMADLGKHEDALRYVEQNADPDAKNYGAIVTAIAKWKQLIRAEKSLKFEREANVYYTREIFNKQRVTGRRRGGFRALDAYPDDEVARLLQEFLLKYPNTLAAKLILPPPPAEAGSRPRKIGDMDHLRDCMMENLDPSVTSQVVISRIGAQHDIDVSARRFGAAYLRLKYLERAYSLIMTPANYEAFRSALRFKLDDVLGSARIKWKQNKASFDRLLSDGSKSRARKKLNDMKESYGGIPEFGPLLTALDQRV